MQNPHVGVRRLERRTLLVVRLQAEVADIDESSVAPSPGPVRLLANGGLRDAACERRICSVGAVVLSARRDRSQGAGGLAAALFSLHLGPLSRGDVPPVWCGVTGAVALCSCGYGSASHQQRSSLSVGTYTYIDHRCSLIGVGSPYSLQLASYRLPLQCELASARWPLGQLVPRLAVTFL